LTVIWYHVRDLDSAREFYTRKLGFSETGANADERWVTLAREATTIGLAEGEPQAEGAVAHIEVDDVKRLAEELRSDDVETGVVFELHGEMRLLDVFDRDGNRLQFAQELSPA
jgi:catechol 2,3-dioxygenase-like lactoylglutathione lyase family enzyme